MYNKLTIFQIITVMACFFCCTSDEVNDDPDGCTSCPCTYNITFKVDGVQKVFENYGFIFNWNEYYLLDSNLPDEPVMGNNTLKIELPPDVKTGDEYTYLDKNNYFLIYIYWWC